MADIYHGLTKKEVVRIKVIQHNVNHCDSQCCRFSVAPELTTYEILHNLIARAFNIKRDFQTSYLTRDERLPEACWVSLSSEFDLQLAFQKSSDPYLLVKADLVIPNDTWEVPTIDLPKFSLADLPKNNYSIKLPGLFKEKMEKTFSIVQKAFNWNEEEQLQQHPLRPPLTDSEFQKMLDTLGTLKDTRELRLRVYIGGVEPSLRKVVWKHILNVYPDNLAGRERMDYMKDKTNEYFKLCKIWQDHLENTITLSEEVKYITNMVRKDVLRTDRHHPFFSGTDDNSNVKALYNILTTYALNHPSVGYCQGMSDLASPLLVTMKDEAQAYVCFCALMSRVDSNFRIDGDAMTLKFQHLTEALLYYDAEFFTYLQQHQAEDLLFCYRWLLLELKREFAFSDAQLMLEVLWSSLPPNPPEESVHLVEVPFNPVQASESPPISVMPRQSHYANVCALRRQRSVVSNRSAECLAAILQRRAATIDVPSGGPSHKVLSRAMSQPLNPHQTKLITPEGETQKISPVHSGSGIKEEPTSPEQSPSCDIKILDLKEFKKLTGKVKSPEKGYTESYLKDNTREFPASNGTRRCFSDSDADVGVPALDGGDVEVWQNPISPDEDESLEIVIQEEKPLRVEHKRPVSPQKVQSQDQDMRCSSVNSCEEVGVSGWVVSVSSALPPPTLPPPSEFGGGTPFLIFLCVTMLMQQRDFIMNRNLDHNELAMHFDKMVRKHDVHKVLTQARRMFEAYLKFDFQEKQENNLPTTTSSADGTC